MFTSDEKKRFYLAAFAYLIAAAFLALFGAIYEVFSHGVYSFFMIYSFAIPLLLGTLPYLLMGLLDRKIPRPFTSRLWAFGIAALAVGCSFQGVLEIAGLTNRLIYVYPVVAAIMFAAALLTLTPRRS